jgi:hypothetical protein
MSLALGTPTAWLRDNKRNKRNQESIGSQGSMPSAPLHVKTRNFAGLLDGRGDPRGDVTWALQPSVVE